MRQGDERRRRDKQLLLIEDDPAIAVSIALILSAQAFVITHAKLGEEGFELGRQHDYDIVLLDLGLPDMHGYQALRKLCVADVSSPVLVLSGAGDMTSKVAALRHGADNYVTKPFSIEELWHAFRR